MSAFDLTKPLAGVSGALRPFITEIEKSHSSDVQRAAVLLLASLREQLSRPGTGRLYRVSRGGLKRKGSARFHRASVPGASPAPMFGELRRGSTMGPVGGVMRVGVTSVYGPWLDRGTSRVAPRPFMAPALERVKDQMARVSVTRT